MRLPANFPTPPYFIQNTQNSAFYEQQQQLLQQQQQQQKIQQKNEECKNETTQPLQATDKPKRDRWTPEQNQIYLYQCTLKITKCWKPVTVIKCGQKYWHRFVITGQRKLLNK